MVETQFTREQFDEFINFFDNFKKNVTSDYTWFLEELTEKCENKCMEEDNDGCVFKDGKYDVCKLK